jgi:hypothetical protein
MPNGQIIRQNPPVPQNDGNNSYSQMLLLDAVQPAGGTDPGIWMPWLPFHKGSLEVTSAKDVNSTSTMSATITLMCSNAATQPPNAFQITLSSSITTGDVLTVTISCPALPNGQIVTNYTVLSTDTTLAILTASLAAAITAAIKVALQDTWTQDQNINAGNLYVTDVVGSHTININWLYPMPPIQVTVAKSGGASETIAVAPFDDGEGFAVGSSTTVTSIGNVVFDQPAAWIKAKCTSWVSGALTAIVVGVLP